MDPEAEVEQLLAHPNNWRIHGMAQQKALAGVIGQIGYIRSVTVNKVTGHVIDGHLRVALALRTGQKTIPVEYVELSPEEEALALLTLDPIAGMAESDRDNVEILLQIAKTDDEDIASLLAGIAEQAGVHLSGDLDEIEELFGDDIDDEAFNPILKLKLPPELHERWLVIVGDHDNDNIKAFTAILDGYEGYTNPSADGT
jgi:ParB-like chromosome segregation protein Spo0J